MAELEALEWLQDQIAVFSHGDNNEASSEIFGTIAAAAYVARN